MALLRAMTIFFLPALIVRSLLMTSSPEVRVIV
jgi:hypothetical protein